MRRSSLCGLVLMLGLASAAARGSEPVPGTSFERHVIKDGIGRILSGRPERRTAAQQGADLPCLRTADNAVPALSQEIAVAKLTAARRDVTVRRVADADHSLRQPGAANLGGLDQESRAALD